MPEPSGEPIALLVIGLSTLVLFTGGLFAGALRKWWLRLVLIVGFPAAVMVLGTVNTYRTFPDPCDTCIVSPRAEYLIITFGAGVASFVVASLGVLIGALSDRISDLISR